MEDFFSLILAIFGILFVTILSIVAIGLPVAILGVMLYGVFLLVQVKVFWIGLISFLIALYVLDFLKNRKK